MVNAADSDGTDGWDPQLYERFVAERSQPFFDLVALCSPLTNGRSVDLGCGPGELTVELSRRLQCGLTIGIDNSPAMLASSARINYPGVTFEPGDIADFGTRTGDLDRYDLVFSNAALQWVAGDHREILSRWRQALRPCGQLAVQVPSNADHASHVTAADVACEEPFLSALGGEPPPDPVLGVDRPEHYAQLLYKLGFAEQHVRLQVYGHLLPSAEAVVEWVSGTSLVRFRSRLNPKLYESFIARYRERLLEILGDQRPYFYAFKRILIWGRLPE